MRSAAAIILLAACGVAVAEQPQAPSAAPSATTEPAAPTAERMSLDMHRVDVESMIPLMQGMLDRPIHADGPARRRLVSITAQDLPSEHVQWALNQALKAQGLALWEGDAAYSIGVLGPPPSYDSGALIVRSADGNAAKLGRLVDRLWRSQVKVAHRGEHLAVRGDAALLREIGDHLRERDLITPPISPPPAR